MKTLKSLNDLYHLIAELAQARRELVRQVLDDRTAAGKLPDGQLMDILRQGLDVLLSTTDKSLRTVLAATKDLNIEVSLDFEVNTLKYDLMFLELGQDHFLNFLHKAIPGARHRIKMAKKLLPQDKINCWFTDRDGTVIDYCERYRSCVQPVYNAVILSRFAKKHTKRSIMLTSGPLEPDGVLSLSTCPENAIIHAGSKGREFVDTQGKKTTLPISEYKQAMLHRVNKQLNDLVRKNPVFGLVGSGLQYKFGQTTLARQDKHHSIPVKDSEQFLCKIEQVVHKVDPKGQDLKIEDTGLDVEIILTTDKGGQAKAFDKGHGVDFLNTTLGLELDKGLNLVSGDTEADLGMVREAAKLGRETCCVFVTKDTKLATKAMATCEKTTIFHYPDEMILLLAEI